MSKRLFVGLMSGTSADGIDAALVEISDLGKGKYAAQVVRHVEMAWPGDVRRRLLAVMAPAETTTQEICELNVVVAQQFAKAVERVLAVSKTPARKIAAIGSHGQTVCHLPPGKATVASTLQIGDPSVIATLTGIRAVGNFRPADMAVGGQGAPLVPWTDQVLLQDTRVTRCVQNIGGIANVTYLPKTEGSGVRGQGSVVAFDTGPGNMLMDALVSLHTGGEKKYDAGGQMAASGVLEAGLFRTLQKHPYFKRKPPKSTGRELFGMQVAEALLIDNRNSKIENLIHTATRLTAWSIADAYRRFLPRMPDEVVLCGGGADNPVLVGMLRNELGPTIKVRRIDEFGIPNKAKEAASFALLAAATIDGVPANLPSVTGARRPVILGVIANPI